VDSNARSKGRRLHNLSAASGGGWISGIAFGKNLWHHAKNSAYAFENALNGGSRTSSASDMYWNNDQVTGIPHGIRTELMIPVIPSGKDKIVYFIEHNNSWLGT
jgi:hypothetical protein